MKELRAEQGGEMRIDGPHREDWQRRPTGI